MLPPSLKQSFIDIYMFHQYYRNEKIIDLERKHIREIILGEPKLYPR